VDGTYSESYPVNGYGISGFASELRDIVFYSCHFIRCYGLHTFEEYGPCRKLASLQK
jgi:hypothetical protein